MIDKKTGQYSLTYLNSLSPTDLRNVMPFGYKEGDGDAGYWYQIGNGRVHHHPTKAICRQYALIPSEFALAVSKL